MPQLDLQAATLEWAETGEWQLQNDSADGNPFDLLATVAFTHEETGESVTTEMFYLGGETWAFRFTGTRPGVWSFETRSDDQDLDGHRGRVTVDEAEPDAEGFLEAAGNKLVVMRDNGRDRRGVLYNVFVNDQAKFQSIADLPPAGEALLTKIDELIEDALDNGFNALFIPVNNNWFSFGALAYDEHDSEEPDPATFVALETILVRARGRGLFVHLWAWGDERRRWTPKGVGGINGAADRRLQRYIAARLAPLPGWTMSYGFDLEEWVEPDQVRSWAEFLHERSGWPPLLMAREYGEYEGRGFELGAARLDVFSTDDRPTGDFYRLARERLEVGKPVLFERRFVYRRDGVWDADTTRRAMWQFAMAGGAGSIWGLMFDDPTPYPNPEQFVVHRRFWHDRLHPDMQPRESSDTLVLTTPGGDRSVYYREDATEIRLDLGDASGEMQAVAVDARGASYEEIDLGMLPPGEHAWEAPYPSDWAIAVGF